MGDTITIYDAEQLVKLIYWLKMERISFDIDSQCTDKYVVNIGEFR